MESKLGLDCIAIVINADEHSTWN